MKRSTYLFSLAVSLLMCTAGYADEGSPLFFNEAYFTKPQSPDAWAMTRYGQASLDLFHGTAGLTVPVYTYQDKDFTIPVSLSYASTGFMPGAAVILFHIRFLCDPHRQTGISIDNYILTFISEIWTAQRSEV